MTRKWEFGGALLNDCVTHSNVIPFQSSALDDEGSVRQLCGSEDDRCVGADPEEDADAANQTAHEQSQEIYLRQAHNCQD